MPTILYLVTDGYAEDNVPAGPFCPCDPVYRLELNEAIEDLLRRVLED